MRECPNSACKTGYLEVYTRRDGGLTGRAIVCENCGLSGPTGLDKESAIAAWDALPRVGDGQYVCREYPEEGRHEAANRDEPEGSIPEYRCPHSLNDNLIKGNENAKKLFDCELCVVPETECSGPHRGRGRCGCCYRLRIIRIARSGRRHRNS